jgi:hypothetical protein
MTSVLVTPDGKTLEAEAAHGEPLFLIVVFLQRFWGNMFANSVLQLCTFFAPNTVKLRCQFKAMVFS